jgi:small conductance mechanosensitive channel
VLALLPQNPLGRALAIVGFFVLAWLVARLAGIAVGIRERLAVRRAGDPGAAGRVFSSKQRETAISLVRTTVQYLAFAAAVAASIVTLVGGRKIGAIAGASFVGVLLAFSAQRVLTDVIQGLFIFFERWYAVGDTITVLPWGVEGIVESVSLRATTVRGVNGELMRVHNSQILAIRMVPSGLREFEIELFASELERGRRLVERVARLVPTGPTHFVHAPEVRETEELGEELFRITAHAAVPPGREWLVEDFLPSLVKERAGEDLLVHGPVVMPVDEAANRRFARIVSAREQARKPRVPLARLGGRGRGR